jgi:hypothetical protein
MKAGAPDIVEDSSQFHSASLARASRPYRHTPRGLTKSNSGLPRKERDVIARGISTDVQVPRSMPTNHFRINKYGLLIVMVYWSFCGLDLLRQFSYSSNEFFLVATPNYLVADWSAA